MKLFCTLISMATLWGCASYSGNDLKPGQSTLQEVRASMGEPAAQWINPDHSMQLSYPRGPAGYHSFMVYLDAAGRLQRIENVMQEDAFYKVESGMNQSQVTRILGPPVPAWTSYFAARNELVWEWRYCDDWTHAARFDVLFDRDQGTVRSTMGWPEMCGKEDCLCSR